MRKIYVMIKCDLGRGYEVASVMVETIEQVSEVDSISGQYDLLAKFYLPPTMDIGRFVTENVQTLSGVRETFTMVAFNAFT